MKKGRLEEDVLGGGRKRNLVSVDDGSSSQKKKVAVAEPRSIVSVDGTVTVPGKSSTKSKGFAAMNLSPEVRESKQR